MGRSLRLLLAGVLGASLLIGPPGGAAGATTAVLVGAGDIASCSTAADQRTAGLLDGIGGTVFTAGDNAYPRGTLWQFRHCYAASWGRHFDRTRPAAGNHDYGTPGAAGYFDYFRWRAGHRGKGWYAYNRGTWRIYVLNSNCAEVGGCYVGSRQERWLRADLAAHPHRCVLAYWHHPRFSSGFHGNQKQVRGFWVTLYGAGADIVVNGHDHDYERFAPQDYSANADPANGIREFVVGSGGAERRAMEAPHANSEVSNAKTYGVLKLTLRDGSYAWRFVGVPGSTFTDSGSDTCH
jgi:hypothetical protein